MNVSSILFRRPQPVFRLAGAKVQLLFKPASFFKKNFFFFSPRLFSVFNPCNELPSLSVREGKDTIFSLYHANVF
jgi:hypothetical protein